MGDTSTSRWPRVGLRSAAWTMLLVLLCLGYTGMVIIAFGLPGTPEPARVTACLTGILVGSLLCLVFGVTAATRRGLERSTRRAWALLSVGFLCLNLIPVGLAMSGQAGQMQTGDATWADLFRLLFVPAAVAGLLTFPRSEGSARVRYKIGLDMVTIIGGAFMIIWYVDLGPLLAAHRLSSLNLVVAVAYPIGDLILLFGATAVLLHGAAPANRRPILLLVGGLAFMIANDWYLGYLKGHHSDGPVPADRWQYGAIAIGTALFVAAAIEQCRGATTRAPDRSTRPELKPASRLPYLALAVGYGLLFIVAARTAVYPWAGLVAGAAIMTAGVAARQILAMRENHDLVVTDSLTGLANRRRLHETLARVVERAARNGQPAAVLVLDMDGFKQVNDSLGHESGDQLLVGFANLLKANVLGSDVVARMGGDEFAIVLGAIGEPGDAEAVANRIIAAMELPLQAGEHLILPRASIGIAVTDPAVPLPPAALLHDADLAMYRAKGRRGTCWERHINPVADARH